MKKQWLVEGFCPVDRYHCLMPVEYESVESDGVIREYHKVKMVCRHVLDGNCEKSDECSFFMAAPEKLEKNVNWYES